MLFSTLIFLLVIDQEDPENYVLFQQGNFLGRQLKINYHPNHIFQYLGRRPQLSYFGEILS